MAKYYLVLEGENGIELQRDDLPVDTVKVMTLGRSQSCTVRLPKDDVKISAIHASFEVRGEGIYVLDQSKNGTFIDDRRIGSGILTRGHKLKVGGCTLHLEIDGPVAAMITLSAVDLKSVTVELLGDELKEVEALVAAHDLASSHGPKVFRRLGDFDLLDELGSGGFGAVYRARQRSTGTFCAVKLLLPSNDASADAVRRFAREQDVLKTLNHPNIVRFLASGEVRGVHYLATEYVPGGTLEALAPCKDRGRAFRIARELFGALEYMHEHKVIHRDIKPANVLLSLAAPDGTQHVRVADLGFAKAFDAGLHTVLAPALTEEGKIGGTLRWSSPEQFQDFRKFRPSVDIYSAAATLYYLLTGKSHLKHDKPLDDISQLEQYHLVSSGDRVSLFDPDRRPDLRGSRASVLDQLLTIDPKARDATSADDARSAASLKQGWV